VRGLGREGVTPRNSPMRGFYGTYVYALFAIVILLCLGPILSAASGGLSAQSLGRTAPTVDRAIQSLMDDSEALPPEFASDVSLRLIEGGLVTNQALKVKLLTRAFKKASAAQDDLMRRPWGISVEETQQGLHAIASSSARLDRITLQARVVHELLLTEPRRARQVFESIPPPQIEQTSCGQNWYFVPDAYYTAAGEILTKTFPPNEISAGLRSRYLVSVVRNIQSHVQILPLTQLLDRPEFTRAEIIEALTVYAAGLGNLNGDPLSFYVSMYQYDRLWEAITKLVDSLDKHDIDPRLLIQPLRDYLVRNFRILGCTDMNLPKGHKSDLPESLTEFNKRFVATLARLNVSPISEREIAVNTLDKVEDITPQRWKSQTYFQMLHAVQKIDPPGVAEAERGDTSDWTAQAQDALNQLAGWSAGSENETEFFHQKAIVLEGLAERTIGASIHTKVVEAFVLFLEQNSYQQVSRVDWFLYAHKFLSEGTESGKSRGDLLKFLNSGDPVLNAYARIQLMSHQAQHVD
jgi:hypothetical protein